MLNVNQNAYIFMKKELKEDNIRSFVFANFCKSRYFKNKYIYVNTGICLKYSEILTHYINTIKISHTFDKSFVKEKTLFYLQSLGFASNHDLDLLAQTSDIFGLFSAAWKESKELNLSALYKKHIEKGGTLSERQFRFQFNFWVTESQLGYYKSNITGIFYVEHKTPQQ